MARYEVSATLALRLSMLSAPAPNATICSGPPAIITFLRKWIIWFWSAKLLWNASAFAEAAQGEGPTDQQAASEGNIHPSGCLLDGRGHKVLLERGKGDGTARFNGQNLGNLDAAQLASYPHLRLF
jgi:hypothetical protein